MTEEWVLTGDSQKDDAVRSSHRYASAPNFILFKVCIYHSFCSHPISQAFFSLLWTLKN
jgi:zinc finger FYVE domain-containing protein 26